MAPVAVVIIIVIGALVMLRKKPARPTANADVFRALMNNPGAQSPPASSSNDPEVEKLRQNLRVKLLYQDDKIDHAIAIERERNPGGSQLELLRAAIDRWERDNR